MLRALILIALFALTQVNATEPAKCRGDCSGLPDSVVGAAKETEKSSRLLQPRRQAAAINHVYSDVPLRPAPGMTAWKPKPKKEEIARKTVERSPVARAPAEPPIIERRIISMETASANVEEHSRVQELKLEAY
jgi:hypothetical protein